jgi:hypothetical protein
MASGRSKSSTLGEMAAVRLWPCARPLECGVIPQRQQRDRGGGRFSSQVSQREVEDSPVTSGGLPPSGTEEDVAVRENQVRKELPLVEVRGGESEAICSSEDSFSFIQLHSVGPPGTEQTPHDRRASLAVCMSYNPTPLT